MTERSDNRDSVRGDAPLLSLRDVHVDYGGLQAVRGVDLHVGRGEVVALLGANGSGKSSLLSSISGLHRAYSGSIEFDGHPIDRLRPYQIARLGISHVPEGRLIFPAFDVEQNLRVGALARGGGDLEAVLEMFPTLRQRAHQAAASLSGGEQQMLLIGRALMSRPELLLLDEPSHSLAPIIVGRIYEALADINRLGTAILLVEQNAGIALRIASRAYVLESGVIALRASAAELRESGQIRRAYLGAD